MKKFLLLLAVALGAVSCGTAGYTRGELYPQMYEEKPAVVLVMPPINNTANVEAKDLLYTSISRPLAEAGYYVISPLLAMDILKAESAYDAELFFDTPLKTFGTVFGADAVVFSVIDKWVKQGVGISTTIRYVIKSTRTDAILFDRTCDLFLDLDAGISSSGNGLVGALVNVAATLARTALTDHIEAARRANYFIFRDLPAGKYSPDHLRDMDVNADSPNISTTVN